MATPKVVNGTGPQPCIAAQRLIVVAPPWWQKKCGFRGG